MPKLHQVLLFNLEPRGTQREQKLEPRGTRREQKLEALFNRGTSVQPCPREQKLEPRERLHAACNSAGLVEESVTGKPSDVD